MQSRSNNRCDEFVVFAVTLLVLGVLGRVVEAQDPAPHRFVDATEEKIPGLANARACWGDVNGDGWVDLCAGAIWLNKQGKSFEKISDGYGGVVAADIDNDGDVDLFSWSSLSCLKNDGTGRFEAIEMPELPRCVSLGASFADFNNDGYVDIYVGGYEDWNAGLTFPDLLLVNQAGERFELAWQDGNHRARGVTSCDFDQDGDADV